MTNLQTKILTGTWVQATWEQYIQTIENPAYEKAKTYYYNGQAKIEMSPVGPNHAKDNGILTLLVNLFGISKNIPMILFTNCSYRKTGIREAQPDASYYIGERIQLAPTGSSVVNLDTNQPPDLAIEIADTSLADDLGAKRLLYEELKVGEYWIVDVQKAQIIALKIIPKGSEHLSESEVLPGLQITLLEQALQRSRQTENTEVGNWFLSQIQAS